MAYLNGWTDKTIKETVNKRFTGRATNGKGQCQYLTDNGKVCGVGIFIPEGHKAQRTEGSVGDMLAVNEDLINLMPLNLTKLRALQSYHDSNLDFDSSTLAEQKNLLFNKIKSLANGGE